MLLARPKFLEQGANGLGFRHKEWLAHDLAHGRGRSFLVQQAGKHILGMENSDHVVASIAKYGNARMTRLHNDARHFRQGHILRHAVNVRARDHGVLHLKIVEAQDAEEHGFFIRLHFAFGPGLKNGLFQRFFAVVPEQTPQARPDGTMTFRASVQNRLLCKRKTSRQSQGPTAPHRPSFAAAALPVHFFHPLENGLDAARGRAVRPVNLVAAWLKNGPVGKFHA